MLSFARNTAAIAAEAATDGAYVIRTSLPVKAFDDAATVHSYKSLAFVEHAFRCIKTVELHVRPSYHRLADRVRAHVFLCMLAYYLEWHMRQRRAPMLFDDTDKGKPPKHCAQAWWRRRSAHRPRFRSKQQD